MLNLTRKLNEGVMIGDDIEVVVLELNNGQVKLGIAAPDHVKIYRDEIYERIQKQKRRKIGNFNR